MRLISRAAAGRMGPCRSGGMADAAVSNTAEGNLVWVRLPSSAPPSQSTADRHRRSGAGPALRRLLLMPGDDVLDLARGLLSDGTGDHRRVEVLRAAIGDIELQALGVRCGA